MKVKRLLVVGLSMVILISCFAVRGFAENSTFMSKTTSTNVYINSVEDVSDLTLYRAEYVREMLVDVKSQKISLLTGENHFVFEKSTKEPDIVKLFCLDNKLRPYLKEFDIKESIAPMVVTDSVNALPGDEVKVAVKIKRNPGIFGAILSFSYDSKLTLTDAKAGEAFSSLVMTKPGKFASPCNFVWDGMDEPATDDGEILMLTFKVSEEAKIGDELAVRCAYQSGDVVDSDLNEVELAVEYGNITIASLCQDSHSPAQAVRENVTEGNCIAKSSYEEVVYCSVCRQELSREKKLGDLGEHDFYNGKCKYCGEETTISAPTIIVNSTSAKAGETVSVAVTVKNNPGIFGAILSFSYDSKLTLKDAKLGSAFSELVMTKPGRFTSPCNFVWDGMDQAAKSDGEILSLTFEVSETAKSGDTLFVNCSYRKGDVVDSSFSDANMSIQNAMITVK